EDEVATRIRIEGGVMAEPLPEAARPGTSLTVRNLFYNTPARRNFLKNDAAEYKQVYDVVQRIALSHPSLSIKFMSEEGTILFLTIDPRRVDVNVHPSKMEVKFADEGLIYRIVHSAVRRALSANDLIPTAEVREGTEAGGGSGLVFRQEGEHSGLRVADWKE